MDTARAVLPSASDDDGGGFAMFAPPICRGGTTFSVPPDPTKTAATQRTSQRAERAIKTQRDCASSSKNKGIHDLTYAGDMSDPQSNARFHNVRR
jgi:hypothetical protein